MKEGKTEERMCCEQQSVSRKEGPSGPVALYPEYDAEVAEVRRMKEECDRLAHEMLGQIDALLMKIDGILSRDHELQQIGCTQNLSIEDLEFLMHGNTKLEP